MLYEFARAPEDEPGVVKLSVIIVFMLFKMDA